MMDGDAMDADVVQFEDSFEVREKDPDGRKFDKGAYDDGHPVPAPEPDGIALPSTST